MIKKSWLLVVGLLLVSLFIISCGPSSTLPSSGSQSTSQQVWGTILHIGSLRFLGIQGETALIAFVRILIAVLIFAILYEVGHLFLTQNIAITISAILAIITAIFIPGQVLAGIGGAYATLFSLLLIGAPVVGGLWLIWRIPGTTRLQIGLRILILLILLWILIGVKGQALAVLGSGYGPLVGGAM